MKYEHRIYALLTMIVLIVAIKVIWAACVYDDWTCAYSNCRRLK